MTASSQQAREALTFDPCSRQRHQIYSVVGEANEAWSQLSSLKVFQSESRRPILDLVDVVHPSEQPRRSTQTTFHDAEDLDKYLTSNPMIGGTRFM